MKIRVQILGMLSFLYNLNVVWTDIGWRNQRHWTQSRGSDISWGILSRFHYSSEMTRKRCQAVAERSSKFKPLCNKVCWWIMMQLAAARYSTTPRREYHWGNTIQVHKVTIERDDWSLSDSKSSDNHLLSGFSESFRLDQSTIITKKVETSSGTTFCQHQNSSTKIFRD